MNTELLTRQGIDEHMLIGPSHFMNAKHYVDGVLPETILERIWAYNIFPLIEELLWGQKAEIELWRWSKVRTRFATELDVPSTDVGSGLRIHQNEDLRK